MPLRNEQRAPACLEIAFKSMTESSTTTSRGVTVRVMRPIAASELPHDPGFVQAETAYRRASSHGCKH